MAVRQALGAARMRLIRQLLTESLLLFVLGGITGFAVLFCAQKFLLQFVPESLPRLNDISISWGVLAFAIVVSVAAGTIFGLAPAWLTSRLNLTATLRQEGRGSNGSRRSSRLRHVLVIGELALSLVLMVAAGLLLRSFWDLFKVQLGFNPTRVMAIETSLPNPNDPKTDIYRTATQESVLLREILRRNRTIPGVEETAVSDRAAIPLGHGQSDRRMIPLVREGQDAKSSQPPLIDTLIVSPEYFHLLGMTLLRGRLFVDQDLEATPLVAVINQAAARTYWPAKIGQIRSASESVCWAIWAVPGRTGPPSSASLPMHAQNRSRTPAFRRSTSTSTSAPPSFLRSTCADRSILPPSPPRCAHKSRPSIRTFPCSTRRPWTTFSPLRFLCGGSPWKWWRCLPARPCCSRASESMAPSPSWSMSNRERSPSASRWAREGATSSRWCCARASLSPPSAPRGCGRRVYRLASHGGAALRRVTERSPHLRGRHRCAYRRRARGQLYSGAARDAPRSDRGAPLGINRSRCLRIAGANCGHSQTYLMHPLLHKFATARRMNEPPLRQ